MKYSKTIILALISSFVLVACGEKAAESAPSNEAPEPSAQQAEAVAAEVAPAKAAAKPAAAANPAANTLSCESIFNHFVELSKEAGEKMPFEKDTFVSACVEMKLIESQPEFATCMLKSAKLEDVNKCPKAKEIVLGIVLGASVKTNTLKQQLAP